MLCTERESFDYHTTILVPATALRPRPSQSVRYVSWFGSLINNSTNKCLMCLFFTLSFQRCFKIHQSREIFHPGGSVYFVSIIWILVLISDECCYCAAEVCDAHTEKCGPIPLPHRPLLTPSAHGHWPQHTQGTWAGHVSCHAYSNISNWQN